MKQVRRAIAGAALTGLFLAGSDAAGQARFDILIRGARILDGTGNPWVRGDIGIVKDRITAVGRLSDATAARVIEAADRYVTPGFIDVHSHAGPGLEAPALAAALPLLAQGITTVVVNPDGGGAVDLAAQRRRLTDARPGVNVALLAPHGSIRQQVIGMADRPATATELERMRGLVRAAMEAGAFGLSSGPYYAPGSYASTDELIELARVAAAAGGVYTSHIRDEGDYTVGLLGAIDEVIRIAEVAGLPGIVTHIKALGPNVWGFSSPAIRRIERARARGVEVFADQYPYDASSTGLSAALVPRWAEAGGDTAMRRRLADPVEGERIRQAMVANLVRRGGPERQVIGRHRPDPSIEGKSLAEIASLRNTTPIEAAVRILAAGGAGIVSFNMDEADIAAFMRQPWTMTSSDGTLVPMNEGVPHPRAYGTFPRKLRRYVVERRVVSLEAAVRSMTSLPASVFRLADRGVIRPGAKADLLVFDLDRLRDPTDFQRPHRLAEGIGIVLVDGGIAYEDGRAGSGRFGSVLSRR
ncbi:MAG: amidohydrolase family protein [Gemmatimonadetes bacterium]|nr:amidohydrolase family protein [Gemmatimonadota bacterium]MCC7134086.1 amidohydrolase family protein [Gemmatimonadales bacterium]